MLRWYLVVLLVLACMSLAGHNLCSAPSVAAPSVPQPAATSWQDTAPGIEVQGRVIFAAAEGALTLEAWAAFLRNTLGCVDALNFDGGPPTQLAVRGKMSLDIPGGWNVPVFITVEARP